MVTMLGLEPAGVSPELIEVTIAYVWARCPVSPSISSTARRAPFSPAWSVPPRLVAVVLQTS